MTNGLLSLIFAELETALPEFLYEEYSINSKRTSKNPSFYNHKR